jgi:hypothetical protein
VHHHNGAEADSDHGDDGQAPGPGWGMEVSGIETHIGVFIGFGVCQVSISVAAGGTRSDRSSASEPPEAIDREVCTGWTDGQKSQLGVRGGLVGWVGFSKGGPRAGSNRVEFV